MFQMIWRNSSYNNNDINVKDQNGNDPYSQTIGPNFKLTPGYSITARSLSTKFREELKYVHYLNNKISVIYINLHIIYFCFHIHLRSATEDCDGRQSPDRPSSPVLVPGILKNNIAFFENLRNK